MRTILPFVLALAIPAVSMAQPGVPPRIDFLEKRVADGATNVQERITLMNLYLAARNVEKRREQVLWLAGNHPEIPNFRNPPFDLGPSGNLPDPAGFEQAAEIWRSHAAKADAAPPVVVNAAFFFRFADRDFARSILRKLAAAHPGEPNIAKMRGTFDVLEMAGLVEGAGAFPVRSDERLRDSPAAAQARREIESSSDANLICGAAEFLSRQAFVFNSPFNDKPPLGADDPLDLAEKWLLRAAQIDPENQAVQRALGQVYASQGNQAQDPKWKVELLRKADSLIENWGGLGQLAMAEFDAGDDAAATATAQRILDRKPPQPFLINWAHTVLGLIALDQKRVDDAKAELLESARVKGNFEPNRTLAQALVDAGQRDIVVEYLNLCRGFWLNDQGRIEHYLRMVKAPGAHDLLGYYAPGQDLRGREAPKLPLEGYQGKVVAVQFRNSSCKDCVEEFATVDKLCFDHGVTDIAIDAADHAALARQYEVETYPTLVWINKQGRIADYQAGRVNENNLRATIDRLTGEQARLPAPVPSGMLTWNPVAGAESYVVQLDQQDAQGWKSDRDQHLIHTIPVGGTSVTLDSWLGETSSPVIRWRVFAVTRQGPGSMSEWREESLKQP